MNLDGCDALIEVVRVSGSEQTSFGGALERLDDALDKFERVVHAVASRAASGFRSAAADIGAVDELELEFGIGFTVDGSIAILSTSSEATLKVSVKFVLTESSD